MTDDTPHAQREPFLPGGLPLYGTFARFQGALYVCRLGNFPGSGQRKDMVTLISGGVDQPGSEWRLAPHPWRAGCTELTRVIDRSQADEVFDCQSTAQWRGVELGGLLYLPSTNRISGYISRFSERLRPTIESMPEFGQVDRGTWHGEVPFDELERLEIRREPSPAREPLTKRRRLFHGR